MQTNQQRASTIADLNNDELILFIILGSVRYDRIALNELLGGGKLELIQALLDGSDFVQEEKRRAAAEGRVQGYAEGHAEGHVEGRTEVARQVLRLVLGKQFPELESLAEIDGISDVDVLESIVGNVLDARSAEPVRAAILAASKPS